MTISVGGLMSGLDTNGIIDQMLEIQQRPILSLQKKEAEHQVRLSTYGTFKSVLSGIKTSLETLKTSSSLIRSTATSGDTDLFTAKSDETASAGNYSITVSQMADVHKLTSAAFTKDEAVGQGTIHLKIGTDAATDIDISATDTIQDVAKAINDADVGIKAAVIYDGTNYFLTLTGEETGADQVINLTVTEAGTAPADPENSDTTELSRLVYDADGTTNMTNTQSAADAILTVDGVADIQRSTNVIDDVIEGVTLTLVSAPDAPDNASTLSITRNTGAVTTAVSDFISKYNTFLDFIATEQSYDAATGEAGLLLGDATTNTIRNNLKNLITGTVSGDGSIDKLSDLGISFNSENRLEVDTEQLANILKTDFDEVVQFFSRDTEGSQGFAVKMADTLDAILDDTTGTLAARTQGIQSSISNLQDQAETLEMRNAMWEERTRAQFNSLELLLAQYQSTGDYLTQQITGLQNFNSYVANRG
jgi:flagellar hook-associated protein 2